MVRWPQAVSTGVETLAIPCTASHRASSQRRYHAQAASTAMDLPIDCGDFGTCTSSTPFLNVALTFSGSMPAGSAIVREKLPLQRSQQ